MAKQKVFTIKLIGFSAQDARNWASIFRLAQNRPRVYQTISSDNHPADIMVHDADNTDATAEMRVYRTSFPKVPVAASSNRPGNARYLIAKPLIATRALKVLDEVTVHELKYLPELVIPTGSGSEENTASNLVQQLVRSSSSDRSGSSFSGRALVVDDSLSVRTLMDIEVKLAGLQVDLAGSATQAYELLSRNTYTIIFLDVVLPDGDGYKICRSIKSDKVRKLTPVIMLTSKSSPFDRIRGSLSGCNSYLGKPVDHATLQKTIQQYLKR